MELHCIVVTLAAQVTSKVTYNSDTAQVSQIHTHGVNLAILVKG